MVRVRCIAIAFAVAICAHQVSRAQSRAERLQFDVASIKPNKDATGEEMLRTPGGLTATDYPFTKLLEMAYQTKQIDMSRVPEPLRSERFDIFAKASGRISGDQYWEMLRALLEDRFKVTIHRETKDAPVYVLILAKNRSDVGPKMSRSAEADCPVNPTGSNFCGVSAIPGLMVGQRVALARIARELSPFAGRSVQDRTGLSGSFDFQLRWTPDVSNESNDDGDKLKSAGVTSDSSGRSLFVAIQEQLGLKLEPQQGQVEILVVEHAERPSEN